MADPDFASCFGRVVVEHAQMLRQERQVIFTLRSSAPLDKGLCARLTASLQPDYEGFELRIHNLFGYPSLNETALRELMEEMKRDGAFAAGRAVAADAACFVIGFVPPAADRQAGAGMPGTHEKWGPRRPKRAGGA